MEPASSPPRAHQPRHPRYDAIHRALLTGLLSNVGTKTDTHEYLAPRAIRFSIFPGSALFGQKQKWLMAAELVETTKLYARTCAGIQSQWIEDAADHLVERTYSDPRWDSKSASALVTEKVTLHGLVLIAGRTIPYAPIHPRHARELFIHHALVLGDYRTDAPFFRHNARLVEEVQLLEAKIRQRNLLADAATRFAFYDARVPQDVTHGTVFETWRRTIERTAPRTLFMDKADLLRADAPEINAENYPDKLADTLGGRGNLKLPVDYRFEPGEPNDGLTLTIPVAALAQLRAERYEWLVPGMLEDKIAALLRELPGSLRRNFIPVPAWSKSAAAALKPDDISLREALATYLAHQTGVDIKGSDFADASLPPYLRMAFRVVDDAGTILATSRELPQLQRRLATQTADSFISLHQRQFTRDHVTAWDFGDLPESLTLLRFGMSIAAYPALIEQHDNCALRLLPTRHAADVAHRAGVRRLFRIEHRREVQALALHLPHFPEMALKHFTLGESQRLREDLVTLVLDRALFAEAPVPRTQAAYEAIKQAATPRLTDVGNSTADLVSAILDHYHQLSLAMDLSPNHPRGTPALADIREQMLHLIPPHFLLSTPFEWLQQYPRYLASMRLRLVKLESGGTDIADRDLTAMAAISPWWNQYLHRKQRHDEIAFADPELALFRWMLEEFRVHLFTQELGTIVPVSPRRLERQWEKTRQ